MFWRKKELPDEKKPPDEIRRVHLLPDDVLVFKTEDRLSQDQAARLLQLAQATVPGHQLMALDAGLDFEVISRPRVPWPDWRWPAKA